jgi:peptidylprolyl isomerase
MRRVPALMVVATVAFLASCGSSSGSPSTAPTSPPASSGGARATNTAAANPPTITGATNLKAEPTIGPGSAPAPTSLETKDLVVGTGTAAAATSTVLVQYVGADYTNGKVFDSSWQRGQPASFPLSGVVPGFAQGIVGMKAGGRREIVIPPALGYGAQGSPPAVSPNETLVFVVDLLSVQ